MNNAGLVIEEKNLNLLQGNNKLDLPNVPEGQYYLLIQDLASHNFTTLKINCNQ